MASGFAPEFLILVGIDIFLGASILTVLLDRHFPGPLPYVLEGAALIGFAELTAGPTFLTSLTTELQFYYSFIYAMISVMTLFATNLYLLFLRRRMFESAILAICGTVPSALGILFFTSAFVNGLTVSLPLIPVIPIEGIYAMFGLSIGLVVFSLVVFGRKVKEVGKGPSAEERRLEQPILTRATGQSAEEVPAARLPVPAPDPGSEAKLPSGSHTQPVTGSHGTGAVPGSLRADAGPMGARGEAKGAVQEAPAPRPSRTPDGRGDGPRAQGTVLIQETKDQTYAQRLVDSIRFFEKAVDRPVRIDPDLLKGSLKDIKRAYLTPSGMVMAEDSSGMTISLSLMDLSTSEALHIMTEAMRALHLELPGEE